MEILHPEMLELCQIPLERVIYPFLEENKICNLRVSFLLEGLDKLLRRLNVIVSTNAIELVSRTYINSIDTIDLTALHALIHKCQITNARQAKRASATENMVTKCIELDTLQVRQAVVLMREGRRSQ